MPINYSDRKNTRGKTATEQRESNLNAAIHATNAALKMLHDLYAMKAPATTLAFHWGHAGDAGHLAEEAEAFAATVAEVHRDRSR